MGSRGLMGSVLSTGEELPGVALFGVCNRESGASCGFFGAGKPFKQTAPRGLFPGPCVVQLRLVVQTPLAGRRNPAWSPAFNLSEE